MRVLPLCIKFCPSQLPVSTGERIGDGADGEVFSIAGCPNKVIKLGVLYDQSDIDEKFKNIQRVLDYIKDTRPHAYVRVYEHKYFGKYSRDMVDWPKPTQDFILYYYIMEKLIKLSEDEKKVFHTILSHEDRKIDKNYSLKKIDEMLKSMRRGLDFDEERVILFCNNLKKTSVVQNDLHTRNLMKDETGNFKIIDLDRCKIGD
jgi:hypothetical protein